jgi:hypothetical protein
MDVYIHVLDYERAQTHEDTLGYTYVARHVHTTTFTVPWMDTYAVTSMEITSDI